MTSYSQAGQDKFAYAILGEKKDGTFLDIGCHDGRKHSNTLGLEEVGWRGLLVDICYFGDLEKRSSPHLVFDVLNLDWAEVFRHWFPGLTEIDYLSLDVDDATTATLANLLDVPTRYRVITVETDVYRLGPGNAMAQRAMLAEHGYQIMCKDVRVGAGEWGEGGIFEDWHCTPELMTDENIRRFLSTNELGTEIVSG